VQHRTSREHRCDEHVGPPCKPDWAGCQIAVKSR
jgi:hypothetical protein